MYRFSSRINKIGERCWKCIDRKPWERRVFKGNDWCVIKFKLKKHLIAVIKANARGRFHHFFKLIATVSSVEPICHILLRIE